MHLLSSYLCAAAPLHCTAARSSARASSTQRRAGSCRVARFGPRRARAVAARTSRLRAQSPEGVDSESVNVTDVRGATPPSGSDTPANSSYYAGLSEEEIREALLFEQGGDSEGPRLEEAARVREGEGDGAAAVGYQRTIPIPITRGIGQPIVSVLTIFGGLLDRPFGSGASVAAAGSAVIERVQEEIEALKENNTVNEQLLFEVLRVTRLLDMDMKLISAAQKESTLLERLDTARQHCREAILLANAL